TAIPAVPAAAIPATAVPATAVPATSVPARLRAPGICASGTRRTAEPRARPGHALSLGARNVSAYELRDDAEPGSERGVAFLREARGQKEAPSRRALLPFRARRRSRSRRDVHGRANPDRSRAQFFSAAVRR